MNSEESPEVQVINNLFLIHDIFFAWYLLRLTFSLLNWFVMLTISSEIFCYYTVVCLL